jgi:Lon protease-like protein
MVAARYLPIAQRMTRRMTQVIAADTLLGVLMFTRRNERTSKELYRVGRQRHVYEFQVLTESSRC